MEKRNIKLIIAYEGSKYDGWQRQTNTSNTIQEKLEQVLGRMVGEAVEIYGSGRTDAGVHAKMQVVNFLTDTSMSIDEILDYMNQYLPRDIAVLKAVQASSRFHSRLNALKKVYCYRIWNSKVHNVFERNFVYQLSKELSVDKMKEAAGYLTGTMDFKSFTSNKRIKKSTVRYIESIEIEQLGEEIRITYTGNGFLQHMVRILTGTLIEVGLSERTPESIKDIIKSQDRECAGYMVPAKGLVLLEVAYD